MLLLEVKVLRLTLDEGDTVDVVRKVGENHSFFIVVFAEDLVLVKIESVAHTEPEILNNSVNAISKSVVSSFLQVTA